MYVTSICRRSPSIKNGFILGDGGLSKKDMNEGRCSSKEGILINDSKKLTSFMDDSFDRRRSAFWMKVVFII